MPRSFDISGSGGNLLPGFRTPCSSKSFRRSTTNWVTSVLFRGLRAALRALSWISSADRAFCHFGASFSLQSPYHVDFRVDFSARNPTVLKHQLIAKFRRFVDKAQLSV